MVYSELLIFRILACLKPEAYSELWYIQNSGTFKTRELFRILGYSKRHTQSLDKHLWRSAMIKVANVYNYFRKLELFSQYQLFISSSLWNKSDFFSAGLIFTPEVFISCKKAWVPWWSRSRGPWILIYLLKVLQWYYLLPLTFNIF